MNPEDKEKLVDNTDKVHVSTIWSCFEGSCLNELEYSIHSPHSPICCGKPMHPIGKIFVKKP